MKSKLQKQEELKKAKSFLEQSNFLMFTDFSGIKAEDLRKLRGDLKKIGDKFFIIKKRLLGLIFKEKEINFDLKEHKLPVGVIFSKDMEKTSSVVFKLLNEIAADDKAKKKENIGKILGGYSLGDRSFVGRERIVFIGELPPREVLLAQLLGVMAAPIRSLLYMLDQRANHSTSSGLS